MKQLKKLGFKKIKNTGPGFHMWELDSRDFKVIYTDLSKAQETSRKQVKK